MGVVIKKLLIAIFVVSVSVIGCDVPYSGPMLTVNDVDRYLKSMDEDTVCVQDGFDSVCLRVVLKEKEDEREEIRVVHIHPTEVTYEFYYEDRLVLRAKRAMDTTRIAQELIDAGKVQLPLDAEQLGAGGDQGGNGDDENAFEGWTIQIYYPLSFPETQRGLTPETSGFDIRVVEGLMLALMLALTVLALMLVLATSLAIPLSVPILIKIIPKTMVVVTTIFSEVTTV